MAAGVGSRFGTMTESQPKGFIEVGGLSMIKRSIETLLKCGIEKIIIGTGYKHEMYDVLSVEYPQIVCVYNQQYATTNSMWTLWNCAQEIGAEDFLLLESDLIFERRAIKELLSCKENNVILGSDVIKFQDSYFLEVDNKGLLVNCSLNEVYTSSKDFLW